MIIEAVDPAWPYGPAIERAAAILRSGGVVAFPTETVYGLGANALDETAVEKIFEVKGRPSYNPLIVHVGSTELARELVTEWPDVAGCLASRFWPGPLTLVLPKRPEVPDRVTAGLPTVAVRVPHHPVALALLRSSGLPVAAPSANLFTRLSPTTAEHVKLGLGERVDMILDAGPTPVGIESTVLDLTGEIPRLLRPGTISREALEAVVGPIEVVSDAASEAGAAPRSSPGMVGQHYAPRGELRLFEPEARESMAAAANESMARGRRVGALLLHPLDVEVHARIVMPAEPAAYAARLYSALHELDAQGCDIILADAVPRDGEWAGVRDRLTRAARTG